MVRGRKHGLCAVLGFQAINQLRAIYGHEQTATLAAAPATKLILRTGEADTARWSSAQIGEREITRTQIGTNTAAREQRDSFSVHPQRLIESAVLGSEIQMLQRFEGYLCITGHHRARVTIPYLAPVKRHPGFIRRLMAEQTTDQSAASMPDGNRRLPSEQVTESPTKPQGPLNRRLRA